MFSRYKPQMESENFIDPCVNLFARALTFSLSLQKGMIDVKSKEKNVKIILNKLKKKYV